MKTYQIELKRTSYINVCVDAENEDAAEELAWKEVENYDNHADASWDIECIEEITIPNQGE
jgi:hypothetical protein